VNIEEARDVAVNLALQAGEIIREAFHRPKKVENKSAHDFVTETGQIPFFLIHAIVCVSVLEKNFCGHTCSARREIAQTKRARSWYWAACEQSSQIINSSEKKAPKQVRRI
jgi:hypothetical protein